MDVVNSLNEDDRSALLEGLEVHSLIAELVIKIDAEKIFRRAPQPVVPELRGSGPIPAISRDDYMNALAQKAAGTHAAIRLLAEQGLGEDALALCRVLVENCILVEWISREPIYRLELFALSLFQSQQRLIKIIKEHYVERPELLEAAERMNQWARDKSLELFGDSQSKWARIKNRNGDLVTATLSDIFDEVARPKEHGDGDKVNPSPPNKTKSFVKEFVYFRLSAFVHSTASSVIRTIKRLKYTPHFSVAADLHAEHSLEAIRIANLSMLVVVSELNNYCGAGIDAEIDALHARLKARSATEQADSNRTEKS